MNPTESAADDPRPQPLAAMANGYGKVDVPGVGGLSLEMETTTSNNDGDEDPSLATEEDIRRKVEYLMSDENITHDPRMLGLTGGADNWPVSFSRLIFLEILPKYKPVGRVRDALKKSTVLEFTDSKHVRRREPYTLTPVVEPEVFEKAENKGSRLSLQGQAPATTTQTIETKPWLTKNMLKATGFEENFADAPITPAEYATERNLFDPSISFASRIETAINKYRSRRKFHSDTAYIFTSFLSFGGIDEGMKPFGGGMSYEDLEYADAEDIAAMTATATVREAALSEDKWTIDFAAIARGYLSVDKIYYMLSILTPQAVNHVINVISNFYRWLLQHDVCIEYNQQIQDAIRVCKVANVELSKAILVSDRMLDDFNSAYSAVCGGNASGDLNATHGWDDIGPRSWTQADAEAVVKAAIAVYGTEGQYEAAQNPENFSKVNDKDMNLQVTAIDTADKGVHDFYETAGKLNSCVRPIGKLHCRLLNDSLTRALGDETITFWMEQGVLDLCFVGMKIEAHVCESKLGIKWLDRVKAINASYFEVLPNELYDKEQDAGLPKSFYKRLRTIKDRGWMTRAEVRAAYAGDPADENSDAEFEDDNAEHGVKSISHEPELQAHKEECAPPQLDGEAASED